jgi:hypothetical protein
LNNHLVKLGRIVYHLQNETSIYHLNYNTEYYSFFITCSKQALAALYPPIIATGRILTVEPEQDYPAIIGS